MNELARMLPFVFDTRRCNIVDRNGNPWFVAKDVAEILGLTYYRHLIDTFPAEEKDHVVCAVLSKHGTSAKPRARKTQRVLVLNEPGVLRLILKSRKPEAGLFKDRIIKLVADYLKHGANWAVLPRNWFHRGQYLNHAEWIARKQEEFYKRRPDADFSDFLAALPAMEDRGFRMGGAEAWEQADSQS